MVSMTNLNGIFEVRVYPCWTIGSPSGPSQQSTALHRGEKWRNDAWIKQHDVFFAVFLTGCFFNPEQKDSETSGCQRFFCWTTSLSCGMNNSGCEEKQLWDNGGGSTVPRCVVAAPLQHGERRQLSYWDLTALTSRDLVFFPQFSAQCRAITLARVYALCNSKHS